MAIQIPFIGASYKLKARQWDTQRCINMYPSKSESGDSKSMACLEGTPGRKKFIEVPEFPLRGAIEINGRVFWVGGNRLYEIFIDRTYIERGIMNTATGFISMDHNGFQLCIVDGPYGYIFTLATNTFQQITDPYFLGADTVTFIGSYFMFNRPDTGQYYISAQYDGLTGDPADFASAEGSPDNLLAVWNVQNNGWLFGQQTVQIVGNSGGADFPFTPVSGSMIEYGVAAIGSIAKAGSTVLWLGRDKLGSGFVLMANGFQPQRVSTQAIEEAIQGYENIDDAIAYTYQEDGNLFYVLSFPTAKTTWVLDIGLLLWHERAYFLNGEYGRDRAAFHVFAYGKHLVGDYATGVISEQSLQIDDDNGQPIRRERISPHAYDALDYLFFESFQVDMQVGSGKSNGAPEDMNPEVMLQWSNDGGMTWSSEVWVSAGKIGKYRQRAIWRRLGRARDRVWKVAQTARVRPTWFDAYANVSKGMN